MDKNLDVKSFSFGVDESCSDKDESFYSDVESLMRQKQKGKLFDDGSLVLGKVAKQRKVYLSLGRYGKKFMNLTVKETFKDYKSSIKKVNRQIPTCVELPVYEKETKDSYSVKSSKSSEKEFVIPDKKLRKQKKSIEEPSKIDVLDFTNTIEEK